MHTANVYGGLRGDHGFFLQQNPNEFPTTKQWSKMYMLHIGQRVLDLRHRHKESSVIMWSTQTLGSIVKFLG